MHAFVFSSRVDYCVSSRAPAGFQAWVGEHLFDKMCLFTCTLLHCSELDEHIVAIDDEMPVQIWLLPMSWEYSLMVERIIIC